MFVCSKPKIGCSSSITNWWTCWSSFNVRKMMFEFVWLRWVDWVGGCDSVRLFEYIEETARKGSLGSLIAAWLCLKASCYTDYCTWFFTGKFFLICVRAQLCPSREFKLSSSTSSYQAGICIGRKGQAPAWDVDDSFPQSDGLRVAFATVWMSTLRINAFERRQNLTLSQSFLTFGTPHKTPKFARHHIELASVTDLVKVCFYFPKDAELLYKERC